MGKPDFLRLNLSPRCGAKTRSGSPCRSPAVSGRTRCRMHGGAKGSGAPKGAANGNYRHGTFTCEAIESQRAIRRLIQQAKSMLTRLA
ncbi:HGGxSTG domain-containing protein [Microvirga arabica]|nr:HGGxSTG domain-containing protein [Microvirga arabica]